MILVHIPSVVSLAFSPKKISGEQEIRFDVNDSLAANGGSVASLTLGIWSMIGALFTSFSIVNSFLGMALGIWGLNSRKKSMAAIGITLCVVGMLASMLNVTVYFWELVTIPEEELMGVD